LHETFTATDSPGNECSSLPNISSEFQLLAEKSSFISHSFLIPEVLFNEKHRFHGKVKIKKIIIISRITWPAHSSSSLGTRNVKSPYLPKKFNYQDL
jgi:hypothetical protein